MELSNTLLRFSKLNCKSVTLKIDSVKFEYKQIVNKNIEDEPTPFISELNNKIAHFMQRITIKEVEDKFM